MNPGGSPRSGASGSDSAAGAHASSDSRAGTRAVTPEIRRQVRLIELKTRGLVNSLFSGEYRSVFKGQGMEFSEVREYQVGDEVRSIDWNVTARMNRPFVKRFVEERELTVMLVVDLSGSEYFGTVRRYKSELAVELAAVLAMAAARNNDRVGAVFFTDHVEHVLPARKGRRHVLRVLRDLLVHEPRGRGTDLARALQYTSRILKHHSIVFIISDFLSDGVEQQLKLIASRHDIVAVPIDDPAESELPDIGIARFVDPESGEHLDIDTSKRSVREFFAETVRRERGERAQLFRKLEIDEVPVSTDTGFMRPLLRFFLARERRRGRR